MYRDLICQIPFQGSQISSSNEQSKYHQKIFYPKIYKNCFISLFYGINILFDSDKPPQAKAMNQL